MKIDTALYNNEKRHLYFIVDTILSRDLASAFRGLCVSYAPAYTVVKCGIILSTASLFQKHPSGGHSGPHMESSCCTRSCEVKRDGGMSINNGFHHKGPTISPP